MNRKTLAKSFNFFIILQPKVVLLFKHNNECIHCSFGGHTYLWQFTNWNIT